MKNHCSKTVTPENAYEVWQSPNGQFTYFVLKKYKNPQEEAKDSYAKWHVAAQSPALSKDSFEYGDMYHTRVKEGMIQVDNPLCSYLCIVPATSVILTNIGLGKYRATSLESVDPMLTTYMRLAIPKKKIKNIQRILAEHDIRILTVDQPDYIDHCITDVLSRGGQ